MDFTSRYPTTPLTVLAQDPSVLVNGHALTITVPVPSASLAPGPKGYRIHVVDYDSTENKYYAPYPQKPSSPFDRYVNIDSISQLVADRDFHAQNVYGHVATTLAQFESALGRHVSWTFPSGAHHIKVAPHAFLEVNAFYSRRDEALCFGYFGFHDRKPRRPEDYVYTCLSADVVTHESTHAILDGLRRELMRPSTPDQPAFHEGFADCVALLSALAREALLRLVLPKRRAEGRDVIPLAELRAPALKQSVLLGLAEQFGKALAEQHLMYRSATALRRSVEINPETDNYATTRNSEPHELGEILVAATMNAFLELWYARSRSLVPPGAMVADRDRAIEDGARAAQDLLHMMIRAIDYIPPVDMTYGDFLCALLTVDRELIAGSGKFDYRTHIRDSFARYGIFPSTADGWWLQPEIPRGQHLTYGQSGHAEMMWDREAIMRFLWENREALGISQDAMTTVNFVRPAVRTGPEGFLLRETIVEYFQLFDLKASDLRSYRLTKPRDMPRDAPVRLLGGGTLVFDDYGRLKFHIGTGVLSRKQNDRIASMWEAGPETTDVRRFEALHRNRILGSPLRTKLEWM
jgi:hypothetical protein